MCECPQQRSILFVHASMQHTIDADPSRTPALDEDSIGPRGDEEEKEKRR